MPSSTSNFDRPVPGGSWGKAWLAALLVLAVGGGAFEHFVRSRGYEPSLKDDDTAWAWERWRASDGSPHTMAILGASRMGLAFSPSAFAEVLPGWRSVQLAVDGTQPIATLRDLADDPDFRGVALVDTSEDAFPRVNWERQAPEVEAYHRRWRAPGAMVERWLATRVQTHVALLSIGGLRTARRIAQDGAFPPPPYVVTHADRTQFADYSLANVPERRELQLARLGPRTPPTPAAADQWLADALAEEPFVAQIQARGGQVIYVRMPTCDERWAFDEATTPRAQFWDRLAAQTRAVTVHFRDYPELSRFPCPDTSHISSADGVSFTRSLLEILVARGAIAR